MYIVNKNRTQIFNMEHVTKVFVSLDAYIKANLINEIGCCVARYDSFEEAALALELFVMSIGKTEVFFFPQDKRIQEILKEKGNVESRV